MSNYVIIHEEGDKDNVKDFVTRVLRRMPEGAEITLNQLNEVAQFHRIYELYEIVQEVLVQNFQLFKFTAQKDLGESIILKSYLR